MRQAAAAALAGQTQVEAFPPLQLRLLRQLAAQKAQHHRCLWPAQLLPQHHLQVLWLLLQAVGVVHPLLLLLLLHCLPLLWLWLWLRVLQAQAARCRPVRQRIPLDTRVLRIPQHVLRTPLHSLDGNLGSKGGIQRSRGDRSTLQHSLHSLQHRTATVTC